MAHQTPTQRHDAPEQPTPRLGKARARFAGIVAAIALAALAVGYGVTATSLDLSPAPEAAAEAAEPEQPEAVTAQAAEPAEAAGDTDADAAKTPVKEPEAADEAASEKPEQAAEQPEAVTAQAAEPAEAAGDTDADAAKTPVKEPEAADEAASEKPEQADEPAAEKPEQAAQETPAPLVIADLAQASFAHGDKPASHTRYIMLHDTAMDCAEKPEQAAQETPAPLVIADLAQASFAHGDKPASHTRYIMLHDTAMDCAADGVVAHWLANNDGQIASHFIVDRDGTVSQCVPLDQVAYHAGHGDDASYQRYGVDSMNAWSIGIELSHAAGEDYPEAQLDALDRLVAHIDEWSGTQLEIIDHKMWRSGNVDTSEQFATHLANYRTNRTHNP